MQSAPNVVGMVEGSDPVLKHEYVIFCAHMDHVGVQAPRAGTRDSIWNGADDDASGTAAVMELAEAFSRSGARPRRSLIFLTVSGEEKGLWGSDYFASHTPVPISQIVADLNIDMIGRNNHELKSSVEDLNLTNADLNNLMASTDIGTIFLDRELVIQRFTPSAQKIFNLIESDRGRPISDITSRLNYQDFVAEAENVLRDLRMIERELQVADGAWYLTRIAPYRTTEDRIAGVVATFIDITRRKEAEEALRRSEARLRSAIEIETIGVFFFSRDGRITETNEAFLKMSGYTRDDVEEGLVRWDKMTPPEWMSLTHEEMNRFGATGKIGPYEKQYIRKDGTRWWGLFTGTKLGENFGVEYVLDVSDKKEAEERLRASEERFRQFAENSADVFWILDAKTQQLEYINPIYEKMFGQPRELVMRDRKRGLDLVMPEDRQEVATGLPRALAGETFTRNYRIIRPSDGEQRWIRDTGFPIRDAEGNVVRIAGVAQDVTDEKERSELLRESEEKLRLLIEGAPEYAMFLMDSGNHIIYWSKGAERVFGWTAEEALGQTGEIIFTPEDRANEAEEKEMAIARRDGSAPDRRWHMRKDGTRIWVDGIMHRLDDENGELAWLCQDRARCHRAAKCRGSVAPVPRQNGRTSQRADSGSSGN